MTVKLLTSNVLVRANPVKKRIGSLELPDAYQKKPGEGTVVAVGEHYFDGGTTTDFGLKVGDVVHFRHGEGEPFEDGNESLLLVPMGRLIGVQV